MKTTGKWLMALVLATMAGGQALAETGKANNEAPAVKLAAWERVGEANANGTMADAAARTPAPGESVLRARKADMVRRMFWIVMAHR
ncbi:MAG: hypothetical protein HGA75_11525 [Thiobacillus sp.]|nr:hypothetical protein [Thiobacillus sp.]